MPEDHYVDILVDLQHIKTWRNVYPDSVNVDSLKQVIFNKYAVSEDQFKESHAYYQQQVEQQLVRIEEAIRRLEGEKNYIEAHIDSVKKAQRIDSAAVDSL